MKAKHLVIHGRVQGVCYRAWTAQQAQNLGISGWVRNRSDGTVEAVINGTEEAVEQMLAACRTGPGAAQVTGIDIDEIEPENVKGFEVRPTK